MLRDMKKEKPVPFLVRLYKKERAVLKRIQRRHGFGRATIIRAAILAYADNFDL